MEKPILNNWVKHGGYNRAELIFARRQLHWAAQIVSSAAHTLSGNSFDANKTSLKWNDGHRALVGSMIADGEFCAAVNLDEFKLIVLDRNYSLISEINIEGETLSSSLNWLHSTIEKIVGKSAAPLVLPHGDLYDDEISKGEKFSVEVPDVYVVLGNWFANANAILNLVKERRGGSEVRCRPQHFDIATLLILEKSGANPLKTIGIGMSPGDKYYYEPYYYVTPWPRPENPELKPLDGGGLWNIRDWFGAALISIKIISEKTEDMQVDQVLAFIESAVGNCREYLS